MFTALNAVTNTYSANCLNQYAGLSHDTDGNLLSDGRLRHSWDAPARVAMPRCRTRSVFRRVRPVSPLGSAAMQTLCSFQRGAGNSSVFLLPALKAGAGKRMIQPSSGREGNTAQTCGRGRACMENRVGADVYGYGQCTKYNHDPVPPFGIISRNRTFLWSPKRTCSCFPFKLLLLGILVYFFLACTLL